MFFAGSPGLLLLFVCFLIALLYVLEDCQKIKKLAGQPFCILPNPLFQKSAFFLPELLVDRLLHVHRCHQGL